MGLTEYNRSSLKLFETSKEIFRTFNIFEYFKLKDQNKYPLIEVENQKGLIIEIENKKYIFIVKLEGLDSKLYISEYNPLELNKDYFTWSDIESNSILINDIDILPLIDFTIETLEGDKKSKTIHTRKKYVDIIKNELEILGHSSHIEFNPFLIKKIFKILNTPCDKIIKVMEKEIEGYILGLENDLTILFNNIPSYMKKNKKYYYGDADYTAEILESDTDNEILIGYNNIVSCDEFFMLLKKKNKTFSVTLETFKNLKKMDSFEEIEYLDAFENGKNTDLVKSLPLSYTTGSNSIKDFSRIAFDVNCLAYSLLEEEPC